MTAAIPQEHLVRRLAPRPGNSPVGGPELIDAVEAEKRLSPVGLLEVGQCPPDRLLGDGWKFGKMALIAFGRVDMHGCWSPFWVFRARRPAQPSPKREPDAHTGY